MGYIKLSNQLTQEEINKSNIAMDAYKLEDILKYPFPFRFAVYSKASHLYERIIEMSRHIPKDVRMTFGTDLVKTCKNLMREIDKVNNEENVEKRIKGWKNCINILNSTSADIVACINNGYIKRDKMYKILKMSAELTKAFLNLIVVDGVKLATENKRLSDAERKAISQKASNTINNIYNNEITMKDKGVGGTPAYLKKSMKDPDPNNNPYTNNMNAIYSLYGLVPQQDCSGAINHFPSHPGDVLIRDYPQMQYDQLIQTIQKQRANNPQQFIPTCSHPVNMNSINKKEDIIINHAYNAANGLVDTQTLKSPVQIDYFYKSRIAKYNNDIQHARGDFKKHIAFQRS